jgi:hypothetical protein
MDTKGIEMHIDRAHEIAMTAKPAATTGPVSSPGLVFVPANRTPARCSSFGAGEARDAGLFGFMGEVVDVAAVFPQGHTVIVISAGAPVAHAVRVADEERSHVLFDAKVDDLPCGFVPQVADAPLGPTTDRVRGPVGASSSAGSASCNG